VELSVYISPLDGVGVPVAVARRPTPRQMKQVAKIFRWN
jgi:hypothetical protein